MVGDTEDPRRFRNWARTYGSLSREFHQPTSESEVVALVRRARREGQTLRAVGAGHSWNDIVCTSGILVNLDRLQREISVDRDSHRVTVSAGIRLHQLNEALAARGLAMSNLGSIAQQSIAGAISTGTHGSGVAHGNLATQVVAMRLVTGAGDVLELSPERQPDVFSAARVSLGALGIITEVTLQCVPAFRLRETAELMRFDEAMERFEQRVAASEFVKFWWLPHTRDVQWFSCDRTDSAATPRTALRAWIEDGPVLRNAFAGLLWAGGRAPGLIPRINGLVERAHFKNATRVGRSDHVLNIPMPPLHREMEYAIPLARAADALRAMRDLIRSRGLLVNFIVEARFVAADDISLSPAHGRATCQLGAYCHVTPTVDAYFEGFELLMTREFEGRPHWGKEFGVSSRYLRRVYPKFDEFDAIRKRLDPDGVFANDFVRRVFA